MREVKAQTRVLKSHLEERLTRQLDWSESLATWLVRQSRWGRRRNSGAKENVGDVKLSRWEREQAFLPVATRREGRVTGDEERMIDDIFVDHHERTDA